MNKPAGYVAEYSDRLNPFKSQYTPRIVEQEAERRASNPSKLGFVATPEEDQDGWDDVT